MIIEWWWKLFFMVKENELVDVKVLMGVVLFFFGKYGECYFKLFIDICKM